MSEFVKNRIKLAIPYDTIVSGTDNTTIILNGNVICTVPNDCVMISENMRDDYKTK